MSQARLLADRRFAPLFWALFLGALNDNLLKNALVILITYHSLSAFGAGAQPLVAASAGIFILPFFLFSASAGQLADKYPKAMLIRVVKSVEVLFMGLAGIGFIRQSVELLLLALAT